MRATSLIVFGLVLMMTMAFALVPNANSGASTGSCGECHDSVLSERTNHFIDTEDDCLFCHETDPTGAGGHVYSFGENDLCVACHVEQDRVEETDVHSGINCIECHDPHGSAIYPHLINFLTTSNVSGRTLKITGAGTYNNPTWIDDGRYSGTCYLNCHGTVHDGSAYGTVFIPPDNGTPPKGVTN